MSPAPPVAPETLKSDQCFSESALTSQLRDLIQARSVNPDDGERATADLVLGALARMDCEVHRVESLPGRESIAAIVHGRRGGRRLVLNGHMDTVGVDERTDWLTDPFAGELRGGYVYGRGACDMKGGLTAILAVGSFVSQIRATLTGELMMHFAIGEERGEPGTASLLEQGFGGDAGIVVEPSALQVATSQRGLAFYEVTLRGEACHAGFPQVGRNPLLDLPQVLETLREYEVELSSRSHPLLPSGTSTPTMVHAGTQPNSVPATCQITVDRRLLPGETPEGELEELRARLARIPGVEVELRPHHFLPAEVDPRSDIAELLSASCATMTGRTPEVVGAPYATDCSALVHGGTTAVVFGPGDPTECHCVNERVSANQLREASLTLAKTAVDFLT